MLLRIALLPPPPQGRLQADAIGQTGQMIHLHARIDFAQPALMPGHGENAASWVVAEVVPGGAQVADLLQQPLPAA